MWAYVAISLGGIAGCCLRYAQSTWVQTVWGRHFPWATLSINVAGSFLMGVLFVLTAERFDVPAEVRLGILTGFLGGYTTFSTFSMETLLLLEQGEVQKALLYVGGSVGAGLLAALAGAYAGRHI